MKKSAKKAGENLNGKDEGMGKWLYVKQGCESGSWKRKQCKRLNFCGSGSTLKKEAGSGSELGSI